MTKRAGKGKALPAHRPLTLTPELQAKICEHIRQARTVEESCKAVGISRGAFHEWCERGRTGEAPFVDFLNATQKARRDRIGALEDIIVAAGRKDWKAADRMLQVLAPKEYAPRVRVHVEEELSHAAKRVEAAFAAEPELLDRVLGALTGDDAASDSPQAPDSEVGGDGGGSPPVHPVDPDPEAS